MLPSPSASDPQAAHDFVRKALQKHFGGDPHLIDQHLPAFLKSPAVGALLDKWQRLETEIFQVWEMEGFGRPPTRSADPGPPRVLTLPNARAGTDYRLSLAPEFPGYRFDPGFTLVVSGLPEGMQLDPELSLAGKPTVAGQFSVKFVVFRSREAMVIHTAKLHVIPDPKSLWKEREPDPSAPFPKPHQASELLAGAGRRLIAASRRGRGHAHAGTFREDDFAQRYLAESELFLIAVADGAGSAKYARRGAQIACEAALAELAASLENELSFPESVAEPLSEALTGQVTDLLVQSARQAHACIAQEAEQSGGQVRDFHTTLLLALAKRLAKGWFFATWSAGDGGIALYQRGHTVRIMSRGDSGTFAGQTRFLTTREIWEDEVALRNRTQFAVVEDFTALALMSDGVSDPKFGTDQNFRQVARWDAFWGELAAIREPVPNGDADADRKLLDWLNFWSKGDHDDRTISILY
ncbi:MAG: PP2C family serine/threonine-protein phosphatase [Bacteroidota bacterium]